MPVLLVVADEKLRTGWAEQLNGNGFRVTALGSEDEARRYLRSFMPSIVVYHARDDEEVARSFMYDVSVRESGPQIPIIALSTTPAAARLAEACGFVVLVEPIEAEVLAAEVARLAPYARRPRS